jgi:DNA replication protein DnaC
MLETIIDSKFGKGDKDFINTISNVDLLIIDDLGTETPNKMKIDELFTVINQRLLNQGNHITKTIISTNLLMEDLFNIYEERICSRIIGNYDICLFYGEDIRIKKKVGA